MEKATVVETGKRFGNMNLAGRFYPEGMSLLEREKIFLDRRMRVGSEYGFDGHKMFMADQKDRKGTYFEISLDYIKDNPSGWSDIPEDILIITDKVPGVVIGHAVADCPVVMLEDPRKGVSAVCHCSAEMIDMKMPEMLVDAIVDAYGSREEDLLTYVSACAGSDWTYDKFPSWAKDEKLWKGGIVYSDDKFHIDIRKVLRKQLAERKLDLNKATFNMDDTITNPNYYSNSASSPYGLNDASKAGRHFAGLFYPENKVKKLK